MTDLDRVPFERGLREMEDAVVSLRREAVVAVVRQEELRSRLAACKERSGAAEREASRALEQGEERLAFQILYRELPALGQRDLLREELVEARRRTIRLLTDAARLDDRVRRARHAGS